VVVHSSLISFGKVSSGAKTFLDLILHIIGPKGTIFVPSFTFDSHSPFNIFTEPPKSNGALSNLIFNERSSVRSGSYIHSYIGLGPKAKLLKDIKPDRSFGSGTFFDLAIKQEMLWVMLGVDMNSGCTLLHHIEHLASVPYRKSITLIRKVEMNNKNILNCDYDYFARSDESYSQNFEACLPLMLKKSILKKAIAPYGESYAGFASDITLEILKILDEDPFFLVKKI
jgi:aminoglycoside N3'-acetyltransferase